MDDKKRCVELATELIVNYFDSLATRDMLNSTGFMHAMAVKTDKDVLLAHIKAWINILTDAKEELEK